MLEDDLRHFPMATTGYLQKIRASKRYQDIIAVDALFNAIASGLGRPHAGTPYLPSPAYAVDWLGYRLHIMVFVLVPSRWERGLLNWMESNPDAMFIELVGVTVSPRLPSHFGVLQRLTEILKLWVEFNDSKSTSLDSACDVSENFGIQDFDIFVRQLGQSKSTVLLNIAGIERIPHTDAQDLHACSYYPSATNAPFARTPITVIERFSAISSSKQQPLHVLSDELHYRCGTEDA